MDVTLSHPGALAPDVLDAWRSLRAADTRYASPFLAPEFAIAAGKIRSDARVLVARGEQGVIDVILPIQVAGSGRARPLGAPLCEVSGPILSEWGPALAMPDILSAAGISTYSFSSWPGAQAAPALKLQRRRGSAVADLGQGFEVWRDAQRELHPRHFRKMRRLTRVAELDFGWMSVSFGQAKAEDLAMLLRWKREQSMRVQRHDVLAPEWTQALLKACASQRSFAFSGVMATLKLGGRLAAAEFGLRSGTVLHGWIAGYDPRFGRCSPGLVLQEKLLECAALAGVTQALLGVGDAHYTRHYASHYSPAGDGVVTASGMVGGARALMAGLLDAMEQGRLGPPRRSMRAAGRNRAPRKAMRR